MDFEKDTCALPEFAVEDRLWTMNFSKEDRLLLSGLFIIDMLHFMRVFSLVYFTCYVLFHCSNHLYSL